MKDITKCPYLTKMEVDSLLYYHKDLDHTRVCAWRDDHKKELSTAKVVPIIDWLLRKGVFKNEGVSLPY